MSELDHTLMRASYWGMYDLIDTQVGRLLDALDRSGQASRTIVILTSDHGEMLDDHGIYLKGPCFYKPAVHVPLIIAWPGTIAPRRVPALVELTDISATILDDCRLPVHPGVQGRSLWPILTGAVDPGRHRDDLYCEHYNAMPWHKKPNAQLTMVRTGSARIVVDHGNNAGELYDPQGNPGEHRNLWNDPSASALKTDMLLRLTNRMAWTVDPLPPRRADW